MVARINDPPSGEEDTGGEDQLQKALLHYDRLLEAGRTQEEASLATRPHCLSQPAFDELRQMLDLLDAVWPRRAAHGARDESAATDPALPAHTQIGRFRILHQLGRGGFGVVYLAEDPQLRRQVAIKLPRPELLLTRELRRRFVREAHAAGTLSHPHILPIYESGDLDGICYLVSPYCSLGSLSEFLAHRETPLTPQQTAELLLQLAEAIQCAHEAGILHRDLKPANVLMEPCQTSGNAGLSAMGVRTRVADFGLAQFLERQHTTASQPPETLVTRTGEMLGTPQYMAPEQVNGDPKQVGPAADVYGLGAILYQVMTGRPPFTAAGNVELFHQVVTMEPPLPSSLRSTIPADLEAICIKCLEKRPERRYGSAAQVAEDLRRFLRGEATIARPLTLPQRLLRYSRNQPVAAFSVVSALFVMLAVVGGLLFHTARVQGYARRLDASLIRERRLAQEAVQQRDAALRSERAARQEAYVSSMSRGLRMLQSGQSASLCGLLQRTGSFLDGKGPAGFEWNYLWEQGAVQAELRGSPRTFRNTAFSASGEYCLTWSNETDLLPDASAGRSSVRPYPVKPVDPHVYVWHVPTRSLHRKLKCDGAPYAASVSAADQVITISGYGTIQTWDLATGDSLSTEVGPEMTPSAATIFSLAAFSPDGKTLAFTLTKEGRPKAVNELRLMDVPSRKLSGRILPASARVTQIRFSSDGNYVAIGAMPLVGSMTIQIFSVGTQKETARLAGEAALKAGIEPGVPLHDLTFVPGRPMLAIGTRNGTVVVWNYESGEAFHRSFSKELSDVLVAASPDGDNIVVGLWHRGTSTVTLQQCSINLSTAIPLPRTENSLVELIQFSPDGKILLYGGTSGHFRLLEWTQAVAPFENLGSHAGEAWSVAFSPDSRQLVTGGDDHLVRLWQNQDGRTHSILEGHTSLVSAVAFSPSGDTIASGSFDSKIHLWTAATGQLQRTLTGHQGQIRALAFVSEERLVSVGADRIVRVWDAKHGRTHQELVGHTDKIRAVVASPRGTWFATAGNDGLAVVWDARDLRLLQAREDESQFDSLAVSPDGCALAAGSHRGRIWIYEMPSMEPVQILEAGMLAAGALAFSADGKTLASGGEDGVVTLWNIPTGQQMMTLPGTQSTVHALAFSGDGEALAAATHDGRITVWRAPKRDLQHRPIRGRGRNRGAVNGTRMEPN